MDNFYNKIILNNYKNPRNFGTLKQPSASSKLNNSACGDIVRIDLKVKANNIQEIKFTAQGCAISIAAASLLTEHVLGKKTDYVEAMKEKDILNLLPIQLSPTRVKCALLSLEVLQKTIGLLK